MTNKDSIKKIKKGPPKENDSLIEVNKIIDNILQRHKEKIEALHDKKIDFEKFSLKNKNGKTIYYLRKSQKKKKDEKINDEILSEKIISEAKFNLTGPPPALLNKKVEDVDKKDSNKKKSFDEIDKELDEILNKENKKSFKEEVKDLNLKNEYEAKNADNKKKLNNLNSNKDESKEIIKKKGLFFKNKFKIKDIKTEENKESIKIDPANQKENVFSELKSINNETAQILMKAGIDSVDILRNKSLKELTKIKRIKKQTAKDITIELNERMGLSKSQESDLLNKEEKNEDEDLPIDDKNDDTKKNMFKAKISFSKMGSNPTTDFDEDEINLLDERIKQDPDNNEFTKKQTKAELKAAALAKKHFEKIELKDNEKPSLIKELPKKEIDEDIQKKSFFKKKASEELNQSLKEVKNEEIEKINKEDFDFEKDENLTDVEKDEAGLLDEKIKASSKKEPIGKENISEGIDKSESIIKTKPFFKKKPAGLKGVTFGSAETLKESSDEQIIGKPLIKKTRFRVANLPNQGSFDDAKMLDEKIKASPTDNNKNENENIGEEKAIKLAKEHIKQKPIFPSTKDKNEIKENLAEADKKIKNSLVIEKNAEHEHVFFDETEESFNGWSPTISEADKKKMSLPLNSKPEILTEDIKPSSDLELPKDVLQTKSVTLTELGFSEQEWEELDFYPLQEPFAFVEILREKESLDKCYFLVEIELTDDEKKLLRFIQDTMAHTSINTEDLEATGDDSYLADRLDMVISEYNVQLDEESKDKIFYFIGKSSLGLGKIDPLMKDPNIEDISCDGANVPLFLYHRQYGSLKSNITFDSEEELSAFIFKLAQKSGKHISIAEPMLDATMPDGSRIQMTLSDEITAKGSTFTIRKFREDPFSPPDLVEFNTMSSEMIAYMWLAIENGVNTLFAGGTASGKTTTLNALTLFVPRESKIVSIEETREINLPHPNWIPGVARSGFGEVVADRVVGEIDMYDLMKAALRQRPEYILVGEIRGREAYVLFQAMATGHATYSTVHADSAQSLIHRLEGKPINIPRVMLQSLDVVCLHVITRVKNKRARRCKQVIEIIDIDPTTKEILTNEVFKWDPVEDKFVYSGKSYILERIRAEKDLNREGMTEELKRRKSIVEWMNKNNIRGFREVANLVARYLEDPNETYKQIMKGAKK